MYLGGNLVSWSSKKQQTVSRSSTKAKYCGLAHVTTKILWLQSLLEELGVKQTKPPLVWCDNLSTISLSVNLLVYLRTKHMELDLYFVRGKVIEKKLQVNHVLLWIKQ